MKPDFSTPAIFRFSCAYLLNVRKLRERLLALQLTSVVPNPCFFFLEQAIRASTLALEVYSREAFPQHWAMTQNNLALAYSNRIRGERAENLEQAIRASTLALEVYSREAFPQHWATTQNNLANAYSDHIRGERAENLEQALAAFTLALEVRTHEAFPQEWAMTQNNLAGAYSDRIRGERADNINKPSVPLLSPWKFIAVKPFHKNGQ